MVDTLDEELERYFKAMKELIRDGHSDKGDRWLMREACRRAGVDWEPFERKFFGPSVVELASSRFAAMTKPPLGLRL